MAYTNLFTNSLIYSAAQLKATVDYEYQRVGADMQYHFKISLSVPNGYFMGDLIGVEIWLDGVKKLTGTYYDPDGTDTNGWVYDNNGNPTAWFTVANKTSGTTACRIRIYDNQGASDYSVYRPSSTTDYSLTVAPAASQPSLTDSSVPFGTAFTINSNRYDAGFTHTYTYVFGGASGTIATQTADASTSWTAPDSLAAQIPTAMSGVGTITCETFSGAVSIGTKTVSFTLEIPTAWVPVITTSHSGFSWVNAPGIVIPSDNLPTYIIQNISTLTLTLASGLNSIVSAYGTTIVSYQVRYGSQSSSEVAYANSAVSWGAGLITQSGAQYAYYKVKDARGIWSAEISEQIMGAGGTIYPYSAPGDTGFNVARNETVNTTADFQMNFIASAIDDENTWTYQRQYYDGADWVDIDVSPVAITGYTVGETLTHSLPYDESTAYSIRVVLVDKFSIANNPDILPTADVPMAWAAWGIGVGKVPTHNGDYDLEVGANGILSDGIVEGTTLKSNVATGTAPLTVASTTVVPNLNADQLDGLDASAFIPYSLFDAKGDLVVGSADNTGAKVTVGANNTVLIADSAQTAGVKWADTTQAIGTNLISFSDMEADGRALWTLNSTPTVSEGSATRPFDGQNMKMVTSNNTSGVYRTIAGLVVGQKYTFSLWAYVESGSWNFGENAATKTQMPVGTSWVRYSHTFTATSTSHPIVIYTYAATTNSTIYVDNVKLELGEFATSYVHQIESGSNANGNYVRYPDGTLICTMKISVTDQAISSAYGSLYTGTRTWTFPYTFTTAPVVNCAQFRWGTGASWGSTNDPTTTSVSLRGIDALNRAVGTTVLISAIAVGRWKA